MGPDSSSNLKWLMFSGKGEEYPIWATRFVAYLQTKGLYKIVIGKETEPAEIQPLEEIATEEARMEHEKKVEKFGKELEEFKERNNQVWCLIALTLDSSSLMFIRHDCIDKDGIGDCFPK